MLPTVLRDWWGFVPVAQLAEALSSKGRSSRFEAGWGHVSKQEPNKPYKKREAFNQVHMGKKGFKVVNLLRALNTIPYKPGEAKRDKKSK